MPNLGVSISSMWAGSRDDEKKVIEGNAKYMEEEQVGRNSGRKMCKFCADRPKESKEESRTKPGLEDESENSCVSSVFNLLQGFEISHWRMKTWDFLEDY